MHALQQDRYFAALYIKKECIYSFDSALGDSGGQGGGGGQRNMGLARLKHSSRHYHAYCTQPVSAHSVYQ